MKKGFTLVELLGVIVVLGLISVITIPIVDKSVKDTKKKLYDKQIKMIELGAKNWGSENAIILPENGESRIITLGQLKLMGMVDMDVENPLTKAQFSNCAQIRITNEDGIYSYDLDEETLNRECDIPTGNVVLSSSNNGLQYTEKGKIVSYIVVYGNLNEGDLNQNTYYEFDKSKVKLTNVTANALDTANVSITGGDRTYIISIMPGDNEGKIKVELETGAFNLSYLDNEEVLEKDESDSLELGEMFVDNYAPTFSSLTNPHENTWANDSYNIGLSGYDTTDGSGLEDWYYRTGENWGEVSVGNETNVSVEVEVERNQTTFFKVCDNSGKCSEEKSTIVKIDKTAPSTPTAYTMNSEWHQVDSTKYYKEVFIVGTINSSNPNPTANDPNLSSGQAGSGIARYEISDDNTNWSIFAYYWQYEMYHLGVYTDAGNSANNYRTPDGTHYRYIRAIDNAGNISEINTLTIKIDNTVPSVSSVTTSLISTTSDPGQTVKICTNDNISSISSVEWAYTHSAGGSLSNATGGEHTSVGNTQCYQHWFGYSSNRTNVMNITFEIKDEAGNLTDSSWTCYYSNNMCYNSKKQQN